MTPALARSTENMISPWGNLEDVWVCSVSDCLQSGEAESSPQRPHGHRWLPWAGLPWIVLGLSMNKESVRAVDVIMHSQRQSVTSSVPSMRAAPSTWLYGCENKCRIYKSVRCSLINILPCRPFFHCDRFQSSAANARTLQVIRHSCGKQYLHSF